MINFTDRPMEAEVYNIIQPFFKRAYKTMEEYVFLQMLPTIVRVHAWFFKYS